MASNTRVYMVVLPTMTLYAGTQILSKAALNRGIDNFVFTFYRTALGSVLLIPIALLFERKYIPPLSCKVSVKIFLQALCGIAVPTNFFGLGLKFSNSIPSSALFNLIPVTTFVLALLFGMETIDIKRLHGIVKTTGVLLCFAGVVILAFYNGPELKPINHHYVQLYHANPSHDYETPNHSKVRWALGVLFMILATTCRSLWQIWQGPLSIVAKFFLIAISFGPLLKEYPSKLLSAALQSLFGTFQTFIIALILQRNFFKWKLGFDITLLAVVYSGIFTAALVPYLQIWVIEKRGPVFLAMNIPITLVITFAISWTFLGEVVYIGSIIGASLMVGGLYNVIWGISRDRKTNQQENQDIEQPVELEPKKSTMIPSPTQV